MTDELGYDNGGVLPAGIALSRLTEEPLAFYTPDQQRALVAAVVELGGEVYDETPPDHEPPTIKGGTATNWCPTCGLSTCLGCEL